MRVVDFIIKELRQLRRDKGLLGMLIMMPILQLLLYGYAVSTDIKHLKTVVCDLDNSSQSRELLQRVIATPGYFDLVGHYDTVAEVSKELNSGRAQVAIIFPANYGQALGGNRTATLQLLLDGSDPNAGTVAGGYLSKILTSETTSILLAQLNSSGKGQFANAGVDGRVQVWYNPTLQSSYSLVPGVVCMIASNLTIILSALAIVREREIGTIEQLLVTPLKSWELILGKLIPYMLMGYVNILIVLALAVFLFDVPMRGSLLFLLTISALFMVGSLGLGLFISALSKTQMQASQLASLILMPSMMLSGFMFPIANMPAWLQPFTYLLPMRYFLTCVRGIMMKGNGYSDLWAEIWSMALLSALILLGATLQFRKKLD